MDKYKIIKLYFFLFLLFGYSLYANYESFLDFYNSALKFNIAITMMFSIGIIVLFVTTIKVFLLQTNLEKLNKEFLTMEKNDFNILTHFIPTNVIQIFKNKIDEKDKSFSITEKDNIIEFIQSDYEKQIGYMSFTVETSLMLGLLGTFVGLLISIASLGDIVDLLVNMKDMDIKVVLESFGKPLQGMGVGFGSSLFGVSVAILLNLFIYILNKNFNTYLDNLNDFFNIYVKKDTVEVKMEEQLKATNKELIYSSEIFDVLNKMYEQNNKLLNLFTENQKSIEGNENKIKKN